MAALNEEWSARILLLFYSRLDGALVGLSKHADGGNREAEVAEGEEVSREMAARAGNRDKAK